MIDLEIRLCLLGTVEISEKYLLKSSTLSMLPGRLGVSVHESSVATVFSISSNTLRKIWDNEVLNGQYISV